ncbi:hypothetical protein H0O02_04080 [Candidatus Micrarchaeota archaeon]|nr:hypothetical protein [Candidatus Micrarchaeota archaeon]
MNAQNQKPDRKSNPPTGGLIGGTPREKVRVALGSTGVLIDQLVETEVKTLQNKTDGQLNEIRTQVRSAREGSRNAKGMAATAVERAGKTTGDLKRLSKRMDAAETAGKDVGGAVGTLEASVEELKEDVYGNLSDISELGNKVKRLEDKQEAAVLRPMVEILYMKQRASNRSTGKALARMIAEHRATMEDVHDILEDFNRDVEGMRGEAEEAKKAAGKAAVSAEHAEELLKSAEKVAQDLTKGHSEISDEFEVLRRTSLMPPPSAEMTAAAEAIDPTPPEKVEVPKVEEKNGNGLLGKIEENDKALKENGEEMEKLWKTVEILLDDKPLLGPVTEPVAVAFVDVSKYDGYETLSPMAKEKILPGVVKQIKEVREQGAILDSLYEATGRLIRSEGLDTLRPPAQKQSVLLEKPVKLESVLLKQIAMSTMDEIAREIRKQHNKISIITNGLERVLEAREKNAEGG